MWECKSINVKLSQAIRLLCRGSRKLPVLFVPIAPVSLVALLGLGAANWLVQSAIAPQIAQAYTARVDLSINHQRGESYQTLLRRAEALARAATQRSFDQDILVTDVSVMVLVQNQGAIAPILSLEVTRQGWRSRPDPQRWAKYYPTAQSLLQLPDTTALPAGAGQQGISSSPEEPPATTYPEPAPPPATPPNTQPATPGRFQNSPPSNAAPVPQQPGTTPSNQPASPAPESPPPPTPETPPQVVPLPTPENQ